MSQPPKRRDVRRLAMQVLYQLDMRGQADIEAIRASIDDGHDSKEVQEEAMTLALSAWEKRKAVDELVAIHAPQWPTHRQPPVDRAILRLASYEMSSGTVPVKVAINEAIELAKEYSSEGRPAFLNGVLDKIAKQIPVATAPAPGSAPSSAPANANRKTKPDGDAWLDDAIKESK